MPRTGNLTGVPGPDTPDLEADGIDTSPKVRIALTGGRGNAKFHALRALGSGVVLPGVLSRSVVGADGREVQPARAAGGTAGCAR
jgi:hypothetical protein